MQFGRSCNKLLSFFAVFSYLFIFIKEFVVYVDFIPVKKDAFSSYMKRLLLFVLLSEFSVSQFVFI